MTAPNKKKGGFEIVIPNWYATWSLHFGFGHWNLNKWALSLLKREEHEFGPTLAVIQIRDKGTQFVMFTPLNHHAEILGMVFAEKYVGTANVIGAVSDAEFQRWIKERDSNIAMGIPSPSETAYNTVFGSSVTGCEFG